MRPKEDLFENTPVLHAVFALALPSVMGQIILVIYNMADTYFVGMTGSDAMITSVTVCMPAFMFLSAISNLFGVGGASVIARANGGEEYGKAYRASSFSVWSCLAAAAVYCLLVLLFRDPFLDLLGGKDPSVHAAAREYLMAAVILGGVPTAASTLFSHLIRASGFSGLAGAGICIGGILNIFLDPLFMFRLLPPGREALGAAAATAVSNAAALLYYVILLFFKRNEIIISLRFSKKIFRDHIPADVLIVGIPACLMTLCENISYAILDNLMSAVGTAAQAGIGVAKKVNMLAHCFVRGMAQGVLPLIGYNYASGNRKRMRSVIHVSAGLSLFVSFLCTAVCLLFGRALISLFIRTQAPSLDYGTAFLRILCLGAPFSSWAYTVISFFQATGRGGRSLALALMRKGLLDIPLMFLLGYFIPIYGIVWATPAADLICCAAAAALYTAFICEAR